MPRGQRHATDEYRFEVEFNQLFGSLKERIILFSAENGFSAQRVAQRMAESLDPLGTRRASSEMPDLRGGAGLVGHALAEMEVALGALGDGQAPHYPAEIQGYRGKTLKADKRRYNGGGWEKFKTPEARRKEAMRRMSLRKDPLAKKMFGKKARLSKDEREHKARQKIYAARSEARKKGLPLPPLPDERAA